MAPIFKIYLPESEELVDDVREHEELTELPGGSETVLLGEDEESLRELNHELLEALGYTVIEAAYGAEALDRAEQYGDPIHLLVTDVVMPGMSGRELAERLAITRPEVKVLYLSGYADHAIVHHGMLKPGIAFLQNHSRARRWPEGCERFSDRRILLSRVRHESCKSDIQNMPLASRCGADLEVAVQVRLR
jgi:CheY-like chemotaxis protein